jgi:hypothetical protein
VKVLSITATRVLSDRQFGNVQMVVNVILDEGDIAEQVMRDAAALAYKACKEELGAEVKAAEERFQCARDEEAHCRNEARALYREAKIAQEDDCPFDEDIVDVSADSIDLAEDSD